MIGVNMKIFSWILTKRNRKCFLQRKNCRRMARGRCESGVLHGGRLEPRQMQVETTRKKRQSDWFFALTICNQIRRKGVTANARWWTGLKIKLGNGSVRFLLFTFGCAWFRSGGWKRRHFRSTKYLLTSTIFDFWSTFFCSSDQAANFLMMSIERKHLLRVITLKHRSTRFVRQNPPVSAVLIRSN